MREIPLGSISGITIRADWSFLIIFALITFGLATGVFPQWHPDWSAGIAWVTAIAAAVLFFASVLTHELSHALVGRAHRVQIRRITLFMFGGVAEMESEPPSWRAELGMAIVGPLTSLLLGVLFLGLMTLGGAPVHIDSTDPRQILHTFGALPTMLLWLGLVNLTLGVFNLVPGFPLDGGRVLRAIMWGVTGDLRRATHWASGAGQGFAWILMTAGVAMILGVPVPVFGGGVVNGIWLAFIGWFLNNAALVSYRQLLVRDSLRGVHVRELMQAHLLKVDPQMSVSTLLHEHLMSSGQRAFPVQGNGRLLGMVSLRDLQRCPRDALESTSMADIMTPLDQLATLSPEQDAAEALDLIAHHDLSQIPVVQGGAVLGVVRREDLLKWLSTHAGVNAGGMTQA